MINPPVPPPVPLFSSPKIFQLKGPSLSSLAGQFLKLSRRPNPVIRLGATSAELKAVQHLVRSINPQEAQPQVEPNTHSMVLKLGVSVDPGLVAEMLSSATSAELKAVQHLVRSINPQEAQPQVEPNTHSMVLKLGVSVDPGLVAEMLSSAVNAINGHLPKLYDAVRCLENEPIDRFKREFGEGFKGLTHEITFHVHNIRELIPGAAVVAASPVADNDCARGWEKIEEVRELLKRLSLSLNNQDPYYEFISDLDALYSAIGGVEFYFAE